MAGSKHPKLLPKAKKDLARMDKEQSAFDKNSRSWIKSIDTAARSIGKNTQAFKAQVVVQKNMFKTYEAKVKEIEKAEAEQKGSPSKEKEKTLKKMEGEADRLREAYNIGAKKLTLIVKTVQADSTIDSSSLMASFR